MAGLQEFKCPCCGGAIAFDSKIQKMKCPYCDTEFEMDALKGYDAELQNEQTDDMEWDTSAGSEWQEGETDGLRTYVCKSCGGEIVGDANMAATTCPFCDNPIVMMGQFAGALKPDLVIPFKLDKKAAKAQEKAARAEAKAQKKADRKKAKELNDDLDMDDETSTGGKIAVFFVTLIIILIWLAIIVLLIKCDVGGFGSSVLAPVLKDVPYVNKSCRTARLRKCRRRMTLTAIPPLTMRLPESKNLRKSLRMHRIRPAQMRNISRSLRASPQNWRSTSRTRRILRLRSKKFYQEVVFSDSAPDIEEYKQYYESIDPADAEIIYRQVVEQTEANDEMDDYVKAYSSMKPKERLQFLIP